MPGRRVVGWSAIVAFGIAARLLFLLHQPFTNDEGSYLYDARTLLERRLPAGDILTKSPAAAGLFLLGVAATKGSLFAARMVSLFVNLATTLPLAALAARLGGQRLSLFAAALWLLGAGPITFGIFGHTEGIAVFFGTCALALWARSLHIGESPPPNHRGRDAVLSGFCFALALATRKSQVSLLLPALLLAWTAAPGIPRGRLAARASAGVGMVLFPWLLGARALYGAVGVSEVLGGGYVALAAAGSRGAVPSGLWTGDPVRGARIASLVVGPLLALVLGGVASGSLRRTDRAVLAGGSWLVGAGALYALWPVVIPEYLPEFFPALTVLAAASLWRFAPSRRGMRLWAVGLLLAWNGGALWKTYAQPWTGMFSAPAVRAAAHELDARASPTDAMLTAALLVPYLSGHRALFDIAHPFWYRLPTLPERVRRTFLPPLADVEAAVQHGTVRWVLVEQFTDYAYLRHASYLLDAVWSRYRFVRAIPNETGYRSNPLLLWEAPRRTRGAE